MPKSHRRLFHIATSAILFSALAFFVVSCGGSSPTGGGSNVTKEFASPNLSNGDSFTHVFPAAKSVPYYCTIHGGPGGVGMSGVITVSGAGAASRVDISITANTLASVTIDVGDTVVWTNNHSLSHTLASDN